MPEPVGHTLDVRVIDDEGNEILSHSSTEHSRDGACQAYGHAVAAVLKHYKEKREDEQAARAAATEAAQLPKSSS